ncbi:MAG TPA: hypothetical protein VGB54_13100, partial [Allosphingosinicella sp.]
MRKLLIIGAMLVAAPAIAQPPVHDEPLGVDIAEAAPDPRDLAEMAGRMDRLVGAIMDLPIGGIVAAVDPEGRGEYRRGDTVRDMATRDDPDAEERLRSGIRGTTRSIGAMTQAFARVMPVLQRALEEMERDMAAA